MPLMRSNFYRPVTNLCCWELDRLKAALGEFYLNNRLRLWRAGDLFIRSIACIACNHKLPHIESWKASQRPIKASLDSDNRVRRLWREFIYWAHHSHGLLSQASSRFKSSVAYARKLFLALVHSTMTRNYCAESSYAWLVAIGCLISRAGKPHGSLF